MLRRLLLGVGIVVVGTWHAAPARAQVQSRPTDPPIVTAVNESWYLLREPIQFAGELYYPAGATVFFDGNRMARTGHYNGVPLYADTTVEPYSVVLVPISRGLLRLYERPRRGTLAGTTASRTPSFPVRLTPDVREIPQAAVSPTALPVPLGAINVYTPDTRPVAASERGAVGTSGRAAACEPGAVGTSGRGAAGEPGAVGTSGPTMSVLPRLQGAGNRRVRNAIPIVSLRRPENNDGLWVGFAGEKWVSAGAAIPLRSSELTIVGEHGGFPVFARRTDRDDRIYLPTRDGLVAPYRLK